MGVDIVLIDLVKGEHGGERFQGGLEQSLVLLIRFLIPSSRFVSHVASWNLVGVVAIRFDSLDVLIKGGWDQPGESSWSVHCDFAFVVLCFRNECEKGK